ncbi:MAG: hypothetical protein FWC53_04360 [Firmicutes bacterium]|nr:hypothetical protein [Bacillota bacterium]
MENASKALIMAGEILIGLIVIGVIAYLFVTMTKPAESLNRSISQVEIDKINSYFAAFQDRKDITAGEVVSSINYAIEQNKKQAVHIAVTVPGISGDVTQASSQTLMNFIQSNTDPSNKNTKKYRCSVTYDPKGTGLIDTVVFQ